MSPNENKEKTVPKSAEESGESEYSAPKFMSLVCIMQMVKLMDAVGILFPQTLPEGTQPITTKREFLDQFATAKMSAHIDCPNCKAFVSYRWYANDVKELKTHLATSVHEDKKVSLPTFYTLFAPSEYNCRLSAVAASAIGNESHPEPSPAVAMQNRCVHNATLIVCFEDIQMRFPVISSDFFSVSPIFDQLQSDYGRSECHLISFRHFYFFVDYVSTYFRVAGLQPLRKHKSAL